jgi:hypothetical protein
MSLSIQKGGDHVLHARKKIAAIRSKGDWL